MAPGFTLEMESKVAPARIFKAGCMEIHNVAPLILPELVKGGELHGGDGGVGTIKQLYFTEALPYRYYKERVDVLDEEKYDCVYTLIEGGDLGTKVSSAVYHLWLVPTADGGCVFKMTAEFDILPGVDAQEYINMDKEQSIGLFKAVEAYLLANPDLYA